MVTAVIRADQGQEGQDGQGRIGAKQWTEDSETHMLLRIICK